MVKEIRYTSIRRVLDNLTEHPLLRDLTLDQVVRYTIRFIGLHGYPKLYQDKIDDVEIKGFKGILPCDLISIIQVKDKSTDICMRSMTEVFTPGIKSAPPHKERPKDLMNNVRCLRDEYIPPMDKYLEEPAFKTQGRIIYTTFPEGMVEIAYKSVPVDDDGFPMLIDNENYLAALEAYIKKTVFTMKFDTGKVAAGVLRQAQQDYGWYAGALQDEFMVASLSEMESITRMWNTMIPQMRHFDNAFKDLGSREYLRKH